MKNILHHHRISFKNAWAGLSWALSTQPNFRIHFFFAFFAVMLGFLFKIGRLEWIVILFTIVLALTGEMINTAIEAVTDLVTTEWRQDAKIAKDVAAGMMLTIALGAVVVSLIIFTPYLTTGQYLSGGIK
jgi:diacylglycerol kinase